jgi:hypothetical protein
MNIIHHAMDGYRSNGSMQRYVYRVMKPDSLFGQRTEDEVIEYLDRMDPARHMIEVCSISPGIRWRSGRIEATRFTMIHAYCMIPPSGNYERYQLQFRREFRDSLITHKPLFILLATARNSLPMFHFHPLDELVREIPGVDSLLNTAYHKDTVIRGFSIYRRIAK